MEEYRKENFCTDYTEAPSASNHLSSCIQRLDEIALRPNPFSTPQFIDLIMDAEQQEKRLGFKERIESLKKLRQMRSNGRHHEQSQEQRVPVEPGPKRRPD
ncbi:hypothetical protein DAPPUDRAFT_272587 [Daphnia pulex]|uniref:Uncharacterized protein n=1 Tax=Daphnia pulex TaxID=6669 RepID=E9I333_DAPPU|nr:hypothetical protein DAPPUDRAFT_272587 [Daphnia pulex]|eukprot:EFX61597.1 hypothetical protein DAPPUDRAFT_272587 [Daphnia pulex]